MNRIVDPIYWTYAAYAILYIMCGLFSLYGIAKAINYAVKVKFDSTIILLSVVVLALIYFLFSGFGIISMIKLIGDPHACVSYGKNES